MTPHRRYLEAKVRTASPTDLMLMLFDGAIRFSEGARDKLLARDYAASCDLLIRAQKIMIELLGALSREDLGSEVYDQLSGHYWFVHGRLVRANLEHDPKWVEEAHSLLVQIRGNWDRAIAEGEEQALLQAVPPVSASASQEAVAPSVNLEG